MTGVIALSEDYDKTKIIGALMRREEYHGCHYCYAKGFSMTFFT